MTLEHEVRGASGFLGDYLEFEPNCSEAEVQAQSLELLYKAVNSRRLVVFAGSGLSLNSGLPRWKDLAEHAAELAEQRTAQPHEGFRSLRRDATAVDDFQLLSEAFELVKGDGRDSIRRELAEELKKRDGPGKGQDIIQLLRKPPFSVRRFVTTNYDLQIERAFDQECGSDLVSQAGSQRKAAELELKWLRPQLMVLPKDDPQKLLLFALGAPGFDSGVFHLHGHHGDPRTMLFTEQDYQRAYLQESPFRDGYARALRLLFASNPVLFVGVGMREPDVMRPLRYFTAMRKPGSREPPWFVLMSEPESLAERYELRKHLFRMYGTKVIYYRRSDDQGAALLAELEAIGHQSVDWYHRQCRIPALRIAEQRPGEQLYHHRVTSQKPYFESQANRKALSAGLRRSPLVVLYGRDGSGKNSLAQQFAETPAAFGLERARKSFCASAKFRNDFSSVLEAALDHLAPNRPRDPGVEHMKALLDVLEKEPHLLVFDGFERLLDRSSSPDTARQFAYPRGEPISCEVLDFLDALAERLVGRDDATASFAGRVVLVSGMIPNRFEEHCCELPGLTAKEVRDTGVFRKMKPDLVDDLTENLNHAYALALIGATLEAISEHERERWLSGLLSFLGRRSRIDAPTHVIDWVIEQRLRWDAPDPHPLWWRILQRITLVTTPLNAATLYAGLFGEQPGASEAEVAVELDKLSEWRLLLPLRAFGHGKPRYTAHTRVRAYMGQRLGGPRYGTGEPHRFVLPGFVTSEEVIVPTSEAGHRITASMADNLLAAIDQEVNELHAGDEAAFRRLRHLTRAAFSLMRARWMTVGLGKLAGIPLEGDRAHCHEYASRLFRLYRGILRCSHKFDPDLTWTQGQVAEKCRAERGLLYPDELSWLLNELMLVTQLTGSLYDANAIAKLGAATAVLAGNTFDRHQQRRCQTGLNSISIAIDLGNLRRAERELDELDHLIALLPPGLSKRHIQAVRTGYEGMLRHFRGEYDAAEELYSSAISDLEGLRHQRALSIFLQHHGELKRERGQIDEALRLLKKAVAVARLGHHIGQVHMARLRLLSVNAAEQGREESIDGALDWQLVVGAALEYAERMGSERVELAVYRVETLLAHANQDILRARERGYQALELAAKLGMRREVAQLLRILGSLTLKENRPKPAEELLRASAAYATEEQYHAKSEEVEEELLVALRFSTAATD